MGIVKLKFFLSNNFSMVYVFLNTSNIPKKNSLSLKDYGILKIQVFLQNNFPLKYNTGDFETSGTPAKKVTMILVVLKLQLDHH